MDPNLRNSWPVIVFAQSVLLAVVAAWAWALRRVVRGQPLLPEVQPRTVPWGMRALAALLLLWFVLGSTASTLYRRSATTPSEAPGAEAQASRTETPGELPVFDRLLLVAVINGSMVFLTPWVLGRLSGATLRDLGLADPDWLVNLGRGLVACLLIAPVCYLIMRISVEIWPPTVHPLARMVEEQFTAPVVVLAVLSSMLLAPLSEELIFRGVLLGWLQTVLARPAEAASRPDLSGDEATAVVSTVPYSSGLTLANILSSLLFAALHAEQWPAPVPIFVLSLGLGHLYQRTGSLWAPLALHGAFNGLSTAALLLGAAVGPGP